MKKLNQTTLFALLAITAMLSTAGCLNHMKAGKVAGSWRVDKIVIHKFDSTGVKLSDTTLNNPGFMILEFQDETEKGGDFELMMDSTTMVPVKSYNKINLYPNWHRFDRLEFGYFGAASFNAEISLNVKRLGRVEMDLEYRETGGAAGQDIYREEWFLIRGN